MKKAFLALTITCLVISACNSPKQKEVAKADLPNSGDQLKRGEFLVATLDCNACHSPKLMTNRGPVPDPNRLLSGHDSNETLPSYDAKTTEAFVLFNMNGTAAIGPWGTSFAGNLTPDATGIGFWSEEQFVKAIKFGKFKGLDNSRPLLPPMPWEGYSKLPDEDIKAIFAYLKSIKPVKNIVPQAILPGT
jgi:cytochrome c553